MTTYTSNINITSARFAGGYVSAWLDSETDTTATIGWSIGCRQKQAALYGQEAYCYVDGSQKGYTSGYLSSSSSDWKTVCTKSGTTTVSKTSSARSVPVMVKTRVCPIDGYGSVTSGYVTATEYVSVKAITVYAPNAPSDCKSTRASDTRNDVSWTAPSTSTTKPVSAILLERSVDGGSWSQIASLSATATSYADTTASADHSYAYRVRSKNSAGTSSYSTSGTTYNTPAAPAKVTASRLAETTVSIAVSNASKTATALELQRSSDGSAWATVATVSGSPVTSTTDEPGGGTFFYRARNTRGSLASAWSAASDAVVTICAPAAPTLLAPASGVVVPKSDETVAFRWLHNPIDGSAQTAAQLRLSTDGGATWETVQIDGSAASHVAENGFAVNAEVTWGVRTKGAHADYGPWSGNRLFRVYQAPTVSFTAPESGFTVENTPIEVAFSYDDPSGSLVSAKLTAYDAQGRAAYTRDLGTATSAAITSSEWVPEDGGTYTLAVEARSSSSLAASANTSFSVDFELPMTAGVDVSADPETGRVVLSVYVVEDDELQRPASVAVSREAGGERVLLADGLSAGAGLTDPYAPLNVDYSYVVTSVADSGAASTAEYPARIDTEYAFLLFGDDLARMRYNLAKSTSVTPSVEYVTYAGDVLPTAHMEDATGTDVTMSGLVIDREEARAFSRMMAVHEPVVAKTYEGDVLRAVPKLSMSERKARPGWAEVSVSLTEIAGDAL